MALIALVSIQEWPNVSQGGRSPASLAETDVAVRCSLIVGTDQANAVKLILLICSIRICYQHT
jgi:hypothetical protein